MFPWKFYSFCFGRLNPENTKQKKTWQVFAYLKGLFSHPFQNLRCLCEAEGWVEGTQNSGRVWKQQTLLLREELAWVVFSWKLVPYKVIRISTKLWPRSHKNIQRKKLSNFFYMYIFQGKFGNHILCSCEKKSDKMNSHTPKWRIKMNSHTPKWRIWIRKLIFQNLFQFWHVLWWPQWSSTHQPIMKDEW